MVATLTEGDGRNGLVTYVLTLPTQEVTYSRNVLLRRYTIDEGRSLLITGTSGELTSFPSQVEIDDADFYFGGGRRHLLTAAEYQAVVDAGFSEFVSVE